MRVGENSDYQALNMSRLTMRHTNNATANVAKLVSGSRINTGADDPGGVTVAGKLRGRASGSEVAAQNAQNAATFAKTVDTAYSQVLDILYREREIVTQSVDPTISEDWGGSLDGLQAEFDALEARLKDIGTNTKYNNTAIFENDFEALLGTDATQEFTIPTSGDLAVIDESGATLDDSGIATIDTLIETVSKAQGIAGGWANAAGYIADGLSAEASNMWNAHESFTRTDTSKEMTNYVKNTILTQQAQLINAQYNQNAYSVLNLLK